MKFSKIGKQIKVRKPNGQFKAATLSDFGISDSAISDGKEKICASCKAPSRPIMVSWVCKCGHRN